MKYNVINNNDNNLNGGGGHYVYSIHPTTEVPGYHGV
jgi:predicted transcriptional regulator